VLARVMADAKPVADHQGKGSCRLAEGYEIARNTCVHCRPSS
jgi:hypothetical protein